MSCLKWAAVSVTNANVHMCTHLTAFMCLARARTHNRDFREQCNRNATRGLCMMGTGDLEWFALRKRFTIMSSFRAPAGIQTIEVSNFMYNVHTDSDSDSVSVEF